MVGNHIRVFEQAFRNTPDKDSLQPEQHNLVD
jgi:hypothetical protein